jgi:hypothetical protein
MANRRGAASGALVGIALQRNFLARHLLFTGEKQVASGVLIAGILFKRESHPP